MNADTLIHASTATGQVVTRPLRLADNPIMTPAREPVFDVADRRCHLIGIGGCGMSGLARMLRSRGAIVTGSDANPSAVTDTLIAEGIPVSFDQAAGELPAGTELAIASAAIAAEHPEAAAAERNALPLLSYAQTLGKCMLGRTSVAIAGTHGKSTTSAMLGHALAAAGIDPTVIVGAPCRHIAPPTAPGAPVTSGFRLGSERIPAGGRSGEPGVLVAEACEFNRSFHHLHPTIAAITSVEEDHLDIYGSIDAIVEAFATFADKLPGEDDHGYLLIAHDNAHRREIAAGLDCPVETIGFNPAADHRVTLDRSPLGQRVTIVSPDDKQLTFDLTLPGEHMAIDAAFAAILATHLGADPASVENAMSGFTGVERRMQFLGDVTLPTGGSARLWDDYGHHPTEIDTTLRALRSHEHARATEAGEEPGRIICVFQPHQHSRTRFLLEQFAQSFASADVVIVPEIYFVRDSQAERGRVSAADLVDRLIDRGVYASHLHPFGAIVDQLRDTARAGDTVVTMGAGPVWRIARAFAGGGC